MIHNAQKGNKFISAFWDEDIGFPLFMAKPTGSDKWMPAKSYPQRMFGLPGKKLTDEEGQRILDKAKEDFLEIQDEYEEDKEKVIKRTEASLAETL
jgi:hypothetical protein